MLYVSTLIRWLQRKRYQYEVTFSLYMLTPTEKFIFNTLALLFISMILIATFFYLPGHVAEMLRRAWFYYAGEETMSSTAGGGKVAPIGNQDARIGANKHGGPGDSGARVNGQNMLWTL